MSGRRAWLLAVVLLPLGCPPAPERDYTGDEVAELESITEIMRLQAQIADPMLAKRDQETFSDDELDDMAEAAPRLEATAARLRAHFVGQGAFDEGFGEWADKLGASAEALAKGARSRKGKAAREALVAMKAACAGCHENY